MFHRLKHHVRHHAHRARHHLRNAFIPHPGNDHRPHALRHKALTAYAVAVIVVKLAVSGLLIVFPGPSATSDLTPSNIVRLTNQQRTANGVKALSSNTKLASAATAKANDMFAKGYFAHISPTNVTPWYWFKQAGYSYGSAGENLAMDFVTAEEVTSGWMNSPSHKKNILNAKYVDIGVAVVSGKLDGVSTTIVVQFFGAPTSVQQQPTQVAKVTPSQPTAPSQPSSVQQQAQPKPEPVEPTVPEPVTPPPPTPPAQPKITSPENSAAIATARPWIGGEAEAGVTVYVYYDGANIGQTTSDTNGYFRIQPAGDIPDGQHTLTAVASRDGLTSQPSAGLSVMIDTQPPSSSLASVTVLPSLQTPGALTVSGILTGEDITSASVAIGSASEPIPASGPFSVEITPRPGDTTDEITVRLTDGIGNVSVVPVASLSFIDVNILQPDSRGLVAFLQKTVFFSQRFFVTLWLFVFVALAVNVLVRIRVQHRATVLYSLLLLYGLSIVMVTS